MVFPLYDDNPLKLPVPPFATWGLIALNVIIFLIQASPIAALQRVDSPAGGP